VRSAAEARAVVDTLADHGADFVKVYENLSREARRSSRVLLPVSGQIALLVVLRHHFDSSDQSLRIHPEPTQGQYADTITLQLELTNAVILSSP
jgi:hypothetical protein